MKKIIIRISILILIIILTTYFILNDNKNIEVSEQNLFSNTIDISREYLELRIKTDYLLNNASNYSNYDELNNDMLQLIKDWEDFSLKSGVLEKQANLYIQQEDSISLINKTNAYTKKEISDVFDKAKAGQKIKTLAQFLGVDTKTAYKILRNDQEGLADARNKAGNGLKILENSAIVIKDTCKVAGFVGGIVISGGAAGIAGASVLGQTAVIVAGADLVLEIGEDSATIGLGDKHKLTKFFSNFRSMTDPAASILSLSNIPGNLKSGFDKFGAIMFGADQMRSVIQDGKVLGINITSDSKIELSSLTKIDVKEWIKNDVNNEWTEKDQKDLEEMMEGYEEPDFGEKETEEKIKELEKILEKDVEDKETETITVTETVTETKEIEDNELEEVNKTQPIEKIYSKNGETYISMIDSKETSFYVSQTQLWKGEVIDFEPDEYMSGKGYDCSWTYYLDGEEVWSQKNTCVHTCAPVGYKYPNGGTLRVELKVDFYKTKFDIDEFGNNSKSGKEISETLTAERFYNILPTPTDNYIYGQ